MKRVLLGVALVFAVQNATAAVEYEFHQMVQSDLESVPPANFTGRAIIDGERSRVDFLTGSSYKPGTYLLSTNGSRSLTFVDPSRKTYLEVNAGSVATALGSARISIANKKVDVVMMDDHPVIAGLPTDHYRLNISYDISLSLGTLTLSQAVNTIEDKFVTGAFGGIAEAFVAGNAIRTGNAEIDELVEMENNKVKGFALKQVISTTTTNTRATAGSQLKVARTATTTREILVTSISPKAGVSAALFAIPPGYQKADSVKDDSQKTLLHVLSMEPSKQ